MVNSKIDVKQEVDRVQLCLGCMKQFGKEFDVCPHCGFIVGTKPKFKDHLVPGTRLYGRYILGKVLGHGGFGVTYLAWDEKLSRAVAIKEFFPHAISTRSEGQTDLSCYDEKSEEFFREGVKKMLDEGMRISKFSSNPHVVNIYDCFEENNTSYIVMEYLEGKDLKEYLAEKGGRLAPEEAIRFITPIINVLEVMHKEHLIHRDISPDNIYLCNSGEVKLLDFGSARLAVEDANKSLSIMVKRGYAPQEQYMSRSKQGPWTDIYAVCATLYKLITGKTPPDSNELGSVAVKSFSEFGINNCDELEKVILHGMESDYTARIQSAPELRNLLAAALNKPTQAKSKQNTVIKSVPDNKKQKEQKKFVIKPAAAIITATVSVLVCALICVIVFFPGGKCGDDAKWNFSNDTLSISGSGEILPSYFSLEENGKCRKRYGEKTLHIVIEEGISCIGEAAFKAFSDSCTSIKLPASLEVIESSAFAEMSGIETVYFSGTQSQWNDIIVGEANSSIFSAELVFTSESNNEKTTQTQTSAVQPTATNSVNADQTPNSITVAPQNNRKAVNGNSVNDGLVSQAGEYVFYQNHDVKWALYRMKPDGSENIEISSDNSWCINAYGDYVYYANADKGSAIYRVNADGSGKMELCSEACSLMVVTQEHIFFVNASDGKKLYRININGTGKTRISTEAVKHIAYQDGYVYYCLAQGEIYRIKSDATGKEKLNEAQSDYINLSGEWIYYRNVSDGNKIYRMKTDGSDNAVFSNNSAGFMNASEDKLYYQNKSDNNYLYCINLSTGDDELFLDKDCRYLNVTADKIYYRIGKNTDALYSADI